MELMAVVDALVKIKRPNCEVHIYSDSKYVVDSIEKKWIEKWKKKGFVKTKNTDLWKLLLPLLTKHKVQFHWVKGHASNIENNRCDYLAVQASRAIQLEEDKGYLQILKEN